MKIKNCFSLIQTMVVIAMLGLFAAIATPKAHAADTFQPNYWVADTNATPITLSNAQSATVTGKKITLRQGRGISQFVRIVSTNATALSVTVGNDVHFDGTNGTTTHPITFTPPANFVGTNLYWTNYPPSFLNNVRDIETTYITNNTAGTLTRSNSVTVTTWWSQDNQASN